MLQVFPENVGQRAQAQTYTVVPSGGVSRETPMNSSDPTDDYYNYLRYRLFTAAESGSWFKWWYDH